MPDNIIPDALDGNTDLRRDNIPAVRARCSLTRDRIMEYNVSGELEGILELDGSFSACCASAAGLVYSPEERASLARLLDRERLMAAHKKGLRQHSGQFRSERPSAPPFWFSVFVQTLSSDDGEILCMVFVRDVTEQVLEKQMFSRLTMLGFDVLGLLYVRSGAMRYFRIKRLRRDSRYENVEDYYTSIWGDIERIIAPEQREYVRQALLIETIKEKLKSADVYPFSYSMERDGRTEIKLLQFSWLDEAKDTLFFCKSDITAQYEAERVQIDQLRAAKAEAEQANDAKSVFLARMSHDLRTPLNGIIGFTRLAMQEDDPAKKQEYLSKIRLSGSLLLDLINDTLDLSRIESGKLKLERDAVGSRELIDTVITALRPSAQIKGIELNVDLSLLPDETIVTDRLKFQKIVLNLVSNALKYTPEGGKVEVRVLPCEMPDSGKGLRLLVRDNGIGMSRDFLSKIFLPFAQELRPQAGNVTGTGLGMAIVKSYVDFMRGNISVESQPGRGSLFTVELPVEADAASGAPAGVRRAAPVDLTGRRILLCEDNELNIEIARSIICARGMIVDCAVNGQEALERFRTSPESYYDAVLMDIRMPVMDGLEAAAAIRGLYRADADVPIIAMTADAFAEDIQKCLDAGMNAHITKPLDPELLCAVIADSIRPEN